MWNDTRRGKNIFKKRYTTRNAKRNTITICIITASIAITALCIVQILHLSLDKTNASVVISDNLVNIYNEGNSTSDDEKKEDEVNNPIDNNEDILGLIDEDIKNKTFTLSALGEIMLGSSDFSSYTLPFKNICEYTKKADYTVANIPTNVVDLDQIENAKSKYVVTKDVINGFNALGIDALNIANDHIVDFGSNILKKSIEIIENSKINVIGREEYIVYAEHNGIRVAFIGINNQIIGTTSNYTKNGIFIYNLNKIKEKITEANSNADSVVVMVHLGLENSHEITSVMSWLYRAIIDAGADVVLGTHALGIYPIEIYNNKPIIYSLGSLITDTSEEIRKKSGIFTFTFDYTGKVTNIQIIPTYIVDNAVCLYYDVNKSGCNSIINYLSKNLSLDSYTVNKGMLSVNIR